MYILKTENSGFLRVEEGDSLNLISKRFKIPKIVLINDNKLKEEVQYGDILIIKKYDMAIYKVTMSDSIASICKKFCMPRGEFLQINGIEYIFFGLCVFVKKPPLN